VRFGKGMWLPCLIILGFVAYYAVTSGKISASLLILLLCPLMHIFMMRGMHGHGQGGGSCHGHGRPDQAGVEGQQDRPGNK